MGDFLGDFSLSLGDFLTKTSGHPVPECHYAAYHCDKCNYDKFKSVIILSIIVLSVFKLSVIFLSLIILSVTLLSVTVMRVIILGATVLTFIMLSVFIQNASATW